MLAPVVLGLALAAGAAESPARPSKTSIDALADRYVALRLAGNPALASVVGIAAVDQRTLPDLSPAGLRAVHVEEDALWAEVARIDAGQLAPQARTTLSVLRELLVAERGLRVCRSEYWDVSHLGGWHRTLAQVAASQPVETADLRDQALQRWSSLPGFVEANLDNLRMGLKLGYSVPKPVVKRVVAQLDGLLATPIEESPFQSPAARAAEPAFKAKFRQIVSAKIHPAIAAYRHFLAFEYLPQARDTLNVTALPNGEACYRALLRKHTTLDRSPAEVFAVGERTVAQNAMAVIDLGRQLYGTDDFAAIVRRSTEDSGARFASAEELLAFSNRTLARSLEKIGPFFSRLPAQAVLIEPIPAREAGSGVPAHYDSQPDVSKPGKYVIPVDTWSTDNRGSVEVTAVHEMLPGHHLQIALAREIAPSQDIFKLARFAAYIEGWARYAERLAEEADIYTTDYARITRRVWPARGMVVDPGIHEFGWSRQQAIDYLKATGRHGDRSAGDLVDRIAATPGQLTAYDSGALEILALRTEAEAALGPDFDIREFHQRVIERGSVPLQDLREYVRAWLQQARAEL